MEFNLSGNFSCEVTTEEGFSTGVDAKTMLVVRKWKILLHECKQKRKQLLFYEMALGELKARNDKYEDVGWEYINNMNYTCC